MLKPDRSTYRCGSDFEHEPLPHPITYVRLLELLPVFDTQDTSIRCRLKTVRLTDYDGCYTALSYAWDHQSLDASISINGQDVIIKSNLHQLLSLYRHKLMLKALPTVFLWVDALCLNYRDARERNSQVQIMPNIFAKAKTVLTWLDGSFQVGCGAHELTEFTAFLASVRKDLEQHQNLHNDRHLSNKYLSTSPVHSNSFAGAWTTLLKLCQHHYWSRLWILLETRFAQNLMFMYQDVLWDWADFRAPFVLMWYIREWQICDGDPFLAREPVQLLRSPAADIVRLRTSFEPSSRFTSTSGSAYRAFRYEEVGIDRWHLLSERSPLSDLLAAHRRRGCSETQDKIYALVGLSDSMLTIDYERTTIELFCAVLLSLKVSLEVSFVSMLAHHLNVQAFQYQQHRRSILRGVPSSMPDQSTADIVGRSCRMVYCVQAIPQRTEISDILQARLGIQKLDFHRITAQQNIDKMTHWSDFPESSKDMPRISGHTPGTTMPIVDGFDLSDTSFRAAMFLNRSSRSGRKAVFGMISTDALQDGDMLVTEEKMYSGLVIRISGLSKTWLTVVGLVLFARKVIVASDFSSSSMPSSPNNTIRSSTLSDFCEHTHPTPFTIIGCDNEERFTLKPHDMQLQSLFTGSSLSSGRHSRASSNLSGITRTSSKSVQVNERRLTSKSDRIERILEIIRPYKRSQSK